MSISNMTLWTAYYPDILPHVRLCPRPLIANAVRNAAIELCERGLVWRETQDPYGIGIGLNNYDFDTPGTQRVHKVLTARRSSGGDVLIGTPEDADLHYPGWRDSIPLQGGPEMLVQMDETSFLLVPTPSTTFDLILSVALKPSRTATKAPTFLFDTYYLCICAGARASLMAIPGKPWTNPQLGAANGMEFNQRVDAANTRAAAKLGRARPRVRAQFL